MLLPCAGCAAERDIGSAFGRDRIGEQEAHVAEVRVTPMIQGLIGHAIVSAQQRFAVVVEIDDLGSWARRLICARVIGSAVLPGRRDVRIRKFKILEASMIRPAPAHGNPDRRRESRTNEQQDHNVADGEQTPWAGWPTSLRLRFGAGPNGKAKRDMATEDDGLHDTLSRRTFVLAVLNSTESGSVQALFF